MAHSVKAYQPLGQLVVRAKTLPRAEVEARYSEGFMTALEATGVAARV